MKTPILFLTVSFMAFQSALADWVVIQKSTTDGQAQELSTKIKGDKTRMDVGQQMSIISDGAAANMVMLMHGQKMMMKMDADSMKGLMAIAGGALGGDKPATKPIATGQKEKVGDYDCEIYTWSSQMGSGKFWIAKDFPNFKELNAAQDKMTKAMGASVAALMPSATDFPGMIVKSELQFMGKSTTSQLVSVKEEAVDEAVFALPTDYQEVKIPGK